MNYHQGLNNAKREILREYPEVEDRIDDVFEETERKINALIRLTDKARERKTQGK